MIQKTVPALRAVRLRGRVHRSMEERSRQRDAVEVAALRAVIPFSTGGYAESGVRKGWTAVRWLEASAQIAAMMAPVAPDYGLGMVFARPYHDYVRGTQVGEMMEWRAGVMVRKAIEAGRVIDTDTAPGARTHQFDAYRTIGVVVGTLFAIVSVLALALPFVRLALS